MPKLRVILLLASFLFPQAKLFSQGKGLVSVNQETQVLSKGAKSVFKCDIYYNSEKDAIVTHHFYPVEFVKMSNRYGEMKIYFPETNSVSIQQDENLASTNELLYYFINNKLSDLGLSQDGFKLADTRREDDKAVTIWQAPTTFPGLKEIKIVYKDMLPVYAEYLGPGGEIIKKVYYGKYSNFSAFTMPLRITEISFESKTDSTISLSVFSNVRLKDFPDKDYFNFKIPDDAKLIK